MNTATHPALAKAVGGASELGFLAGGGEMGARMRALDWSKTPLGTPVSWPQSLKTIVRVMLDSRYAMWMLWGPEFTFFCNDDYLPTVGIKGSCIIDDGGIDTLDFSALTIPVDVNLTPGAYSSVGTL